MNGLAILFGVINTVNIVYSGNINSYTDFNVINITIVTIAS